MSRLNGNATLVTGASAGIGAATVRALASEGADVALAARRRERLEELADEVEDEHGVDTLVVPTDVSEETEVAAAIDDAVEAFGGLDVLVNNAGVGGPGPIDEITTEEYRQLMDVNVDGMFFATRKALSHLRESEGTVVFVGSFAGRYPRPGSSVYSASKWWTRGFAHSLAGTVGGDGVAVSVVNPSEVRTEIGDAKPPMKERYEPGEVTEPEAIADAIVFAAEQSSPDTAQEIDLYRRDKFESF